MWELVAAATGVELGKVVLEQVLNLGKAALEDYMKDFFKDCIQSGVTQVNADALKKPMAEAIGFFIKRFIKELQINDVPETSINHHYKAAIKRFVRDKAVRPILGKAFEKNCKQIDYAQLEKIWMESYQVDGWQFPVEEFDWRRVGKEYVYEVKGIVKENSELRSLLNTELLEDIARNTAQISPGFDVARYRESLQYSYGYLKLYTLDSTDRVDAIKLWNMFIEQTVREALPPTRYELPLDLKRRLQEEGQLRDDLSPEALEHYRQVYFQQPTRKVLEAVAEAQRAVILGDPGSGKSSLLQYLALEWVEDKTEILPLLIELREFAIAQAANFLDFLHCGRGVDWQFDQHQLHQHLLENPTLVMFDGLDEVFDRATQSTVTDDIIRFSQQYPKARVLVTSRIVGYNPERLQHSGFRHFTIQSLDTSEIHEFIDRWYGLSMGNDPDQERLKQRLKDAIANSKAIQNLADNPLLLTMMTILNRRQELPRDRADLYDQASRVLLYHWDVDHKRLQLPMDAIGQREKQEMLRLVAYEMQAGEGGLKGNLISSEKLTRILTCYLRDQCFNEPRERANLLIQQLRERNFILCYRGTDTYGFVHRTFLEYFCAIEIVNRFEKQRTLSFEQLRNEIFGRHWQDKAWYEVLRLICGTIDAKFAGQLIEFLIKQRVNKNKFRTKDEQFLLLEQEAIVHLFLAFECFTEVKQRTLASVKDELLRTFIGEVEAAFHLTESEEKVYAFDGNISDRIIRIIVNLWGQEDSLPWLKEQVCKHDHTYFSRSGTRYIEGSFSPGETVFEAFAVSALRKVADICSGDKEISIWLQQLAQQNSEKVIRGAAIQELAKGWNNSSETSSVIKNCIQQDEEEMVRRAALEALARYWKSNPETLAWFKKSAKTDTGYVRAVALEWLASEWKDDPETFAIIKNCARVQQADSDFYARSIALRCLAGVWKDHSEVLDILIERLKKDEHDFVRNVAINELTLGWYHLHELFGILCDIATLDPFKRVHSWQNNPRLKALQVLLANYPTYSETIELLHDRAINDPDPQLREWAQQQLENRELDKKA